MHTKNIVSAGKNLKDAKKVLIMLHGRGASPEDILSLARHLDVRDFALLAPRAHQSTWYPYSFLAPTSQNEPFLSSALALLKDLVADLNQQGFANDHIYFAGFSQGACLSLEFTTRNATRWGGVVAFTGGLIGDKLIAETYSGDFQGTPVFIGTSDPDPHVPVERVRASVQQLKSMNASVTVEIYNGMGHTINEDEIEKANSLVFANQ
jgi:phospholipase/carboxylesterase